MSRRKARKALGSRRAAWKAASTERRAPAGAVTGAGTPQADSTSGTNSSVRKRRTGASFPAQQINEVWRDLRSERRRKPVGRTGWKALNPDGGEGWGRLGRLFGRADSWRRSRREAARAAPRRRSEDRRL